MPRQKAKTESNTFVKGLITEAGPLTFPENASLQDENFVLNRDGSRQRRFGLVYEDNFVKFQEASLETNSFSAGTFTWKSVENDNDLDIAVIQVGPVLRFFDNNAIDVSASPLNQGNTIVLEVSEDPYSFTESYGKLIIAVGSQNIYVLSYDKVTDVITSSSFRLSVRDTFGLEEAGVEVTDRDTILSLLHNYNLKNQGWVDSFPLSDDITGTGVTVGDPVNYTKTKVGFFPSNADVISLAKFSSPVDASAINTYSPWLLRTQSNGTRNASRGSTILDLFNRSDSRSLVVPNMPTDKTLGGINAVASYAGRVFYSVRKDSDSGGDENTPDLGSMILYSQSTINVEKLSICYAENDPTAEDFNDPLDTDGGFIIIPDSGRVVAMEPLGESLFVFTSKGIWEISGGDNFFSATRQSISKTLDLGVISANSVVAGENTLSLWTTGGIYGITIDSASLRGIPANITQNTIQSAYDGISAESKLRAVGTYDEVSKQARWLFRDDVLPSTNYFNSELIYDLNLQSFYISRISELVMAAGSSPYVIGYLNLSRGVFTDQQQSVVVGSSSNSVQVGGADVHITDRLANETTESSTKYWCVVDDGVGLADYTVAAYKDLNFEDWKDEVDTFGNNGADAPAILLTGYNTDQSAANDKKLTKVTVFMRRTETGFTDDGLGNLSPIDPSSCTLQGQWEWTDSHRAGRWSTPRQVYRLPRMFVPTDVNDPFDYSFTVVKTDNRIRGKGSALSMLFSTSPRKNLHLYGWTREITVEV